MWPGLGIPFKETPVCDDGLAGKHASGWRTAALIGFLLVAAGEVREDEQAKLAGTWKVVSAERDGKADAVTRDLPERPRQGAAWRLHDPGRVRPHALRAQAAEALKDHLESIGGYSRQGTGLRPMPWYGSGW